MIMVMVMVMVMVMMVMIMVMVMVMVMMITIIAMVMMVIMMMIVIAITHDGTSSSVNFPKKDHFKMSKTREKSFNLLKSFIGLTNRLSKYEIVLIPLTVSFQQAWFH